MSNGIHGRAAQQRNRHPHGFGSKPCSHSEFGYARGFLAPRDGIGDRDLAYAGSSEGHRFDALRIETDGCVHLCSCNREPVGSSGDSQLPASQASGKPRSHGRLTERVGPHFYRALPANRAFVRCGKQNLRERLCRDFCGDDAAEGLGPGNRELHVPEIVFRRGKLDTHVLFAVARAVDGNDATLR
jgi:hypothetical protein